MPPKKPEPKKYKREEAYQPMRGKKKIPLLMQPSRRSWLRVNNVLIVERKYDDPFSDSLAPDIREDYLEEIGGDIETVHLTITKGRATIILELAAYTAPELEAMRDFISTQFDREIVHARARDKAAERMLNEYDDDSYPRLYRGVPEVTYRKRDVHPDDQGVYRRSQKPAGLGSIYRESEGLRDDRGRLVEQDEDNE